MPYRKTKAQTYAEAALLGLDFQSFQRQETTFATLNLFILATLLAIHTLFASHWGEPPAALFILLSAAFLANAAELIWLQARTESLPLWAVNALTWSSIFLNLLLSFLSSVLTDRPDSHYFVLMVVPVLEAAFRLRLVSTLAVVAAASFLDFFWIWHYSNTREPVAAIEYFEAGTISLIYLIVGLLVWLLVTHLRKKEAHLTRNLSELERTRERLLAEEKLAAVGRLSAAIAHEIRNPVAMISSALSTAVGCAVDAKEREEMFEIAAKEAGRLERLTTDFLTYARPRPAQKAPAAALDVVAYTAELCRPHAWGSGVEIAVDAPAGLVVEVDLGQIQQALLNLTMNAVQACPAGNTVILRASSLRDGVARFEVENPGAAIPREAASQIFEPFFTTRPGGTGLGLAISRNIATSHGGELYLRINGPDRICFAMDLPAPVRVEASGN